VRRPWYDADLREFARNRTCDVAELVPPEGTKSGASNIATTVRRHIAKHRDQMPDVRCCARNGKVYLYREEKR
jgi:hypothetical protein